MKEYLSNFDSNPLTCDPALFPGTNSPIIAKSNSIFPGKGRGDKALILTYLDSPMAEVFPHYCLFFSILAIFRGRRGVKVGPKVVTLRSVPFPYSVFVCQSTTSGENLDNIVQYLGK